MLGLFDLLFSEPFRGRISELRKLKRVIRQVETAADAASSSLTRFFLNQKLSEANVEDILKGFAAIGELLELEDIANPNVTTEEIVENVLSRLPCPQTVQQTHGAVYRLALYTVVQVLMLVGPVMAEWQKLNFSSTFELPGRVVNKLNEISDQINAQGKSGQAGADESYELQYRDYLLQRFHKVEAGTVRMTTNLDVDLRELFVMPRVVVQELSQEADETEADASVSLMSLAAARRLYGERNNHDEMLHKTGRGEKPKDKLPPTALEQVKTSPCNVIVGLPGAGKSTFFEWLQVKLASVEEQFILGDQISKVSLSDFFSSCRLSSWILFKQKFIECNLLDFNESQSKSIPSLVYCQRLARMSLKLRHDAKVREMETGLLIILKIIPIFAIWLVTL
ncbi:hypothetical protein FM036_39875 [Nostoc sp. HG1]|nr:hypothetical protein [Nostoc sp. HG1]